MEDGEACEPGLYRIQEIPEGGGDWRDQEVELKGRTMQAGEQEREYSKFQNERNDSKY